MAAGSCSIEDGNSGAGVMTYAVLPQHRAQPKPKRSFAGDGTTINQGDDQLSSRLVGVEVYYRRSGTPIIDPGARWAGGIENHRNACAGVEITRTLEPNAHARFLLPTDKAFRGELNPAQRRAIAGHVRCSFINGSRRVGWIWEIGRYPQWHAFEVHLRI